MLAAMEIGAPTPLARIEALARFVFAALAMLFGLPEAMARRPLDRAEQRLARAWVGELERFTRGLVYALALAQPSPGNAAEEPFLSRGGRKPEPGTKGNRVSLRLCAPGPRTWPAANPGMGARAQPLASALFATERLAARYAAAEHALANPQPLARRLARRWARDAATKARDLARAATAPPKSHIGKSAPNASGNFERPPKHSLRRVLLYEQRCDLAAALARLEPDLRDRLSAGSPACAPRGRPALASR